MRDYKADAEILVSSKTFHDGFANLASGLGGDKDKSSHNVWNHSNKNADHVTLSARYREDWLSQKVCQVVPQDLTRKWRDLKGNKAIEADQEFEVSRMFREAYKWARLYGTSFIILDIDDGREVDKPVNWKRLKAGCLRSLQVVDRTRIVALGAIDQTPMSVSFGMPDHYQFVNSAKPIHKDRLIRFEGTELPIYEKMRNLWYSDSVLMPLTHQFDNFHTACHSASQLVQEANIDVVKVEGLGDILATDDGTAAMINRFSSWKQLKSVFGVSLLDSNETYENKKVSLSGISDISWQFLRIVAAAVSIPATRFLSDSPSGLSATGASDMVNYIETLQSLHKAVFDPRLKIVDRLLEAHYQIDESEFEYTWNCIFPESNLEMTERHAKDGEAVCKLVDSGILAPESALQTLITKGVLSSNSKVGKPKEEEVSTKTTNEGDTNAE